MRKLRPSSLGMLLLTALLAVNFQTPAVGAEASPPPSLRRDVVIIGAGLSGLSAGYALKKKGLSFMILEGSPRIGGRVRTVTYERPGEAPITADSGMEEYWESNPGVELLKELKLAVRSDIAASSLRLAGQLEWLKKDESGPGFLERIFNPKERAALLAIKTKIAHEREKLRSSLSSITRAHPLVQISFAHWIEKQRLPKRVSEWIRVSLECEIGTPWSRIAALDGIDEFHIFLGEAGGEKSYRVIGGNQQFTEALASAIGREQIRVNAFVKKVTQNPGGIEVSYLDQATQQTGTVQARYVISTIPLFRLNELQFHPPLSPQKKAAITSQTWGSYFKAHFLLPKSAERFWTQNGASTLPLLSDSELGVIYEGNPDQKGSARILSMLITGDAAEGFNWMPQDEAQMRLRLALEKLWPGIGKEAPEIHLYRYHPRAIAAWPVGRSRFDELSRAVREPEHSVILAGDFTEGTHSSGAFESARRAVQQIEGLEARAQADKTQTTQEGAR